MTPTESVSFDRLVRLGWGLALLGLVLYTFWRIGGFDLTTTLESGRTVPNMYGTVDHPFHASRGAVLLDSLRTGELLRWMSGHQGGYPVEFYPLGVAWLDVAIWALLFGSVPILAVHKVTVALILVLPALAYWLLVRGDRLHPSIAFLAMAFHVAIPGYWLSGGYEELLGWGLVTNVAGATLAVISTVLLARYVLRREHWCGATAVLAIAAGAVSNPRSLFGVVIASLAIGLWALATQRHLAARRRLVDVAVAIGVVGGLALLLAMPVISSLLRYSDQYFFLHYQFYDPLSMYRDALDLALSPRLLWIAIGGAVLVFVVRHVPVPRVSQAMTIAAGLYSLFTIWVATTDNPPPLVEQLEAPRLMPYQRLIMLALAAIAVVFLLQLVTHRLAALWREVAIAVVVIGLGTITLHNMMDRGPDYPLNENALYEVPTVGNPTFADLEDAVHRANTVRPEGTAIFVVGNQQNFWHEQLWAPGIENGTYYYDDWLWYWHSDQPGPYVPERGYYMDNPSDAFTREYFDQHAIGVVIVSDMYVPSGISPVAAARQSPLLQPQGSYGRWDVYSVVEPVNMVSRGETGPVDIAITNGEIRARFAEGSGDILVRHNWFPRWEAEVNGQPAEIVRDESGYMRISAPDGPVEVVVTYGVTPVDWAARIASIAGVAGLILFAWKGNALRPTVSEEGPYGDD